MRIERSKQWWLDRAAREGADVIGAGLVARDPVSESRAGAGAPTCARKRASRSDGSSI